MNPRIAFPFLTLRDAAIAATPWRLSLNDDPWTTPDEFVPHWDSSSTLRIAREIRVDREMASADLQIPVSDLSLVLGTRIGTGQGRLPRLLVHQASCDLGQDNWQATLALEVPGFQLSTVLDLVTEIALASRPVTLKGLAPGRVGDRLWHDRHRFRLEGDEPRFPLEVADIRVLVGNSVAASSPWYLHWSPRDWSRDFHGAIRLYLNSDYPEFIAKVEQQDIHTLQALLGDVIGQVCERLVTDPNAEDLMESTEAGSLGAQAVAWLRLAWPNKDIAFIRSLLENRPGNFRAAVLALAEQSEA